MTQNKFNDAWSKIVADAWSDKSGALSEKLKKDPKGVFAAYGAEFPEDADVQVLENSPVAFHFVLPVPPSALADISDDDIAELYQACPGTQLDFGA